MEFPFLILAVLICVSGFFSAAETSFFGLSKLGLKDLETRSPRAAKRIRHLLEKPTRLVATCLIGNECANVLISNVTANYYAKHLDSWTTITAVNLLTVVPLIVIVGEITPKVIAARQPQAIARATAAPTWFFFRLFMPVRLLIEFSVNSFTRLFGIKHRDIEDIDEEDFLEMLEDSRHSGAIGESEKELIENIFELDDDKAQDISEPLDRYLCVHRDSFVQDLLQKIREQEAYRIPVIGDFPNQVVGVLYTKDLLQHAHRPDEQTRVQQLMKEPLFIEPTAPLEKVFRRMRQLRVHIAFLATEDRAVVGVVRMEDILDHIFGEIWESDREVTRS